MITACDHAFMLQGAFASITVLDMTLPGLWIPLGAAKRIVEIAAAKVLQKLLEKDKKNNVINEHSEVEQQNLESNHQPTATMEGMEVAAQVAVTAEGNPSKPMKKVDIRRAWEKDEYERKHGNKDKSKTINGPAKVHIESLQQKINAIRRYTQLALMTCIYYMLNFYIHTSHEDNYCELVHIILYNSRLEYEESIANDKDLIDPARILYQYQGAPKKEVVVISSTIANRVHKMVESLRSSATVSVDVGGDRDTTIINRINSDNDDAKLYLHQLSREVTNNEITCCRKHRSAITSNREEYVAQRRLTHSLELLVALKGLNSYEKGYVRSSTLEMIVKVYLKAFHNAPLRSFDPQQLINSCVRSSALDLVEQQRIIRCVQRDELEVENIVSVLPVIWYNPHKFITALVELLNKLETERVA